MPAGLGRGGGGLGRAVEALANLVPSGNWSIPILLSAAQKPPHLISEPGSSYLLPAHVPLGPCQHWQLMGWKQCWLISCHSAGTAYSLGVMEHFTRLLRKLLPVQGTAVPAQCHDRIGLSFLGWTAKMKAAGDASIVCKSQPRYGMPRIYMAAPLWLCSWQEYSEDR